MTNHGGPVMCGPVTVFNIFWAGDGSVAGVGAFPANYQTLLNQFVNDLNGSPYYTIASQYGGPGCPGGIGTAISLTGSYTDTAHAFPHTALTGGDLNTEVTNAIAANGWTSDANTYFEIYTPSGITDSITGICGVHYFANPAFGHILDLGVGAGCDPGGPYPNSLNIDPSINTASHEIMETVTDPLGSAWYFQNTAGEIGDQCNFNFGPRASNGSDTVINGNPYIIQQEWNNLATGCTMVLQPPIEPLPSPQRLVDTRTMGGPIPAGQSRCFPIAGLGGIPSNANAVVLNLTAADYVNIGWLTLYPNGQAVPATSTVNFDSHEYAIANGQMIGIGTNGQVCVNAGASASDAILDATGYVPNSATSMLPLLTAPQRLVDTRVSGGPIPAGQSRCFVISGQGGIPTNAAAVVLNATAVSYTANGWLTLYPNGQAMPPTSTVNFDTREYAIANNAIIRIGTDGQVCVNAGAAGSNVILDATGYLTTAGASQMPLLSTPQRLIDTRGSGGPIGAGQTRCFTIAGVGGIAGNALVALLNMTAVDYTANGWLTGFPNGQALPATSTVNFDVNEYAIANGTILKIGTNGQVCVNAGLSASDVVLDATGYEFP